MEAFLLVNDTAHKRMIQYYHQREDCREACRMTFDKNVGHDAETHVWRLKATFWVYEERKQMDAEMDSLLSGIGNMDVDGVGGIDCLFQRSIL